MEAQMLVTCGLSVFGTYTWSCICNSVIQPPYPSPTPSVLSRSIKPFDDLILEAKKAYQERNANQLIIKTVNESATDGPQMWKKACHRFKRPWKSVIVEEQIRETLLRDIQEFMQDRMWYTERGVPWRVSGVVACACV